MCKQLNTLFGVTPWNQRLIYSEKEKATSLTLQWQGEIWIPSCWLTGGLSQTVSTPPNSQKLCFLQYNVWTIKKDLTLSGYPFINTLPFFSHWFNINSAIFWIYSCTWPVGGAFLHLYTISSNGIIAVMPYFQMFYCLKMLWCLYGHETKEIIIKRNYKKLTGTLINCLCISTWHRIDVKAFRSISN